MHQRIHSWKRMLLPALIVLLLVVARQPGATAAEPLAVSSPVSSLVPAKSASPDSDMVLSAPTDVKELPIAQFIPPYDASVLKTLERMGLVSDHLDVWMSTHPTSVLRHLRYMPVALQRKVASLTTFIRSQNDRIDHKTAWREATALVHYSNKYGVSVPLAVGVAHAESRFNPGAQSSKGALGVMQVRWTVHNGLLGANGISSREQMFDPELGVAAGCLLLSRYIKAYGTVQQAMTRYYGGSSFAYMRKVNRNIAKLLNHENRGKN
jgi:hypothetical protein